VVLSSTITTPITAAVKREFYPRSFE